MLHCGILSLSASRPANLRFLSSIVWLVKTNEKCWSVVLHPPCRSCYYTISEWRRLWFNDRTGTLLFRSRFGAVSTSSATEMFFWSAYTHLFSRYGKTTPACCTWRKWFLILNLLRGNNFICCLLFLPPSITLLAWREGGSGDLFVLVRG